MRVSLVCFHLIFYPRLTGVISLPAERVRCVNADSRPFLPINRGFSPSFSSSFYYYPLLYMLWLLAPMPTPRS